MKTLVFIILGTVILHFSLPAQPPEQAKENHLTVSESKTTHLVCPDRVNYVQAGDYSLVRAEVVPELANLVRVKANRPFQKQTSLTVVCGDRIYSFELSYGDNGPVTCPIEQFRSEPAMPFSGKLMPDKQLKEDCDRVLASSKRWIHGRKAVKDGITIRLNGIWLEKDALFFDLELVNRTPMAYDVESFNFWIADKRKFRAANVQEYQLVPQYRRNRPGRIPGNETAREVFVMEKMTIPEGRTLRIEMNEKAPGNTGRKLSFNLKNKDILKARKL